MPEAATFWDRTKQYSSTAYSKALKPGFDKAYNVVNKLEPHVNKLTYKVGSESFWPGTLDKESEKAARILRSFCKDGFYDRIDEEAAAKRLETNGNEVGPPKDMPQGTIRVIKKIPAEVIRNAKGLAIFTCMRTGWVIGGSGGAGILIGRHPETGEWSPPSGIHMQNLSFGFLGGVDFTDTILVINSYKALNAFTKLRCTLGTEVGVAAGPVGIGGVLDTQVHTTPSPVWSYVKSRGLYGGIAVDGNVVIERTDENERFYGERVGVADILVGKVRYAPKDKYKVLMDTIKAAQGDSVDESLLPDGAPPGDMEMAPEGPTFGIPDGDDPDPFGVKALEAQGLSIREAGTHRRATPESFEFKPSPTSPVYNTYRKSVDANVKRKEWRGSVASMVSMDRGTQTDEEDAKSPRITDSPVNGVDTNTDSPLRDSLKAPPPLPPRSKVSESNNEKMESSMTQTSGALGLGIDTGTQLEKQEESADASLKTPVATRTATIVMDEKIAAVTDSEGTEVKLDSPIHKSDDEFKTKVTTDEQIHKEIDTGNEADDDADADTDDDDDDDDDDNYSDFEEVEIVTAVPATAKPKAGMVNIPQRIAPAVPPRNPSRISRTPTSENSRSGSFDQNASSHENDENVLSTVSTDMKNFPSTIDQDSKAYLTADALQQDDEFHSVPPTPVEEKKPGNVLAAS